MVWLKALISACIFLAAIYLLDVDQLIASTKNLQLSTILFSVLFNITLFSILGYRWHVMLCRLKVTSFKESINEYCKATYLNFFTPANIGGDVYRFSRAKSRNIQKKNIIELLLKERVVGLFSYLLIYCVAAILSLELIDLDPDNPFNYGLIIAVLVLSTPLYIRFLISICSGIRAPFFLRALKIAQILQLFFSSTRDQLLVFLTFISFSSWLVGAWLITQDLGLSIPILELTAIIVLVELARLIPVTVQGIGIREALFAFLVGWLGYDAEPAFVAGTAIYIMLSISIILMGPISYFFVFSEGEGNVG
ncbi:MAG: lysylphosphatidylglycerol synthase transmembrane domain-containing protein [Pseudomonadales bacterium]|nr:lysylphosphatidylglycerol synthase transmembrane domain-containing protein [Pseudomonadales bacterium]MDG1443380.1 lysylphosphatidylglycerol synthase transmembrane domain-containing protein [Pseudomonadales bacterium]